MTPIPGKSSILIIGAGPSGLMMAAQLLRNGIQPVIVDAKTKASQHSKALVIQARSLEIFRQMGLHQSVLNLGNKISGLVMHKGDNDSVTLELSDLGESKSYFSNILILEQSRTERILIDFLTANTCPIYWNSELVKLSQSDTGVAVEIKRGSSIEVINCDWLIGADGASSKVRKLLSIPFRGGTYHQQFYLADVQLPFVPNKDVIQLFIKNEGFAGLFPLKGDVVRFMGMLPNNLSEKEDITFADIKPYLTFTLDFPLQYEACNWFSVYQLHHRMVDKFNIQRCFLIGDAAHVHSPVGGQGMNTGLQDAYNLGWKLAGVIKGNYQKSILESYAAERMPVAELLLKLTDRLFSFNVSSNWFVRKLRNWLLPGLLPILWKKNGLADKVFSIISQTGINYRNSSLSVHHSRIKSVKAGDRLPFLNFYDEKQNCETDLHSWCNATGYTLLVIGTLSKRDLFLMAKWIKQAYPNSLNFYYLPYSKRNKHVFSYFEINETQKLSIIIRPDMHIAYINDVVDIELIDTYLKKNAFFEKD